MKKNDFTGWKDVFRFSFRQGVKQGSYKGFLIFMCVVMLASVPVLSLIQSRNSDREDESRVTMLTIYDETGLPIDYNQALPQERYAAVQVVSGNEGGFAEHIKALEDSEDSKELLLHIVYEEEGYFNLTFVKAADADLKADDCGRLTDDFKSFFTEAKLRAVDVSGEQMAFINQSVDTRVRFTLESGELVPEKEEQESISQEEYFILLSGIVVVIMIISVVGSNIATSIVTEKSTRVVEYLMINVRPMALIVGKILASLLMVLIQFAAMGVCYLISTGTSRVLFGNDEGVDVAASPVFNKFAGLNVENLIFAVVVILLGVLFYSIIAGLAGASVSRLDEMAEGMKIYQMVIMLGSYFGIFMAIMQMFGASNDILLYVGCLMPVSAPFTVPVYLLLGKIGLPAVLVSIVILAVFTALLFSFTAKVYEALIFYNGKVMKVKDIIRIAKNRRHYAGKEDRQA